ncbi:translation initiation factor eIF2B catalytic subunit epsilon ASCRUDRAFT_43700, partial [Ascoidea rubescens DSM 1968]
MPPSAKKTIASFSDERFQAVVLTDSFEKKFAPLTYNLPRCLLPLCNIPLIEYTLEFLSKNKISEVFLMCSSQHYLKIKDYISTSKWSNNKSSPSSNNNNNSSDNYFQIKLILTKDSNSVGDVLREIDTKNIIQNDFLLIYGDIISNIDLQKPLDYHRLIKKNDRNHIMTMILLNSSENHCSSNNTSSISYNTNYSSFSSFNKCIYYDKINPINKKQSSISLDLDLFNNNDLSDFYISNNLIDPHIDICSPNIPLLFQEYFEYNNLRSDFVNGILSSDLLKRSIYAYILNNNNCNKNNIINYATRIDSFQTYDSISKDILQRFTYPLTLDSNLLSINNEIQFYSHFETSLNNIYKQKNVILSQNSKLLSNILIGNNTLVQNNALIKNSIIGKNCKIGKNTKILNSYIFDNSIVHENCLILNSLIASNSVIHKNTKLNSNCIIGYNCIVDQNISLPKNTKIIDNKNYSLIDNQFCNSSQDSFYPDDNDDDDLQDTDDSTKRLKKSSLSNDDTLSDLLGPAGKGYLYLSDNDDSDVDDIDLNRLNSQKSDDSDAEFDSNYSLDLEQEHLLDKELGDDLFDRSNENNHQADREFKKEALATFNRSFINNHDLDTTILEINTLRMSYNVGYNEVRNATIISIFNRIESLIANDNMKFQEFCLKVMNQWIPLFRRQIFDQKDKNDFLDQLIKISKKYPNLGDKLVYMTIDSVYNNDIVLEDDILNWFDENQKNIKNQLVVKYVDWLRNAESESESENDDGE